MLHKSVTAVFRHSSLSLSCVKVINVCLWWQFTLCAHCPSSCVCKCCNCVCYILQHTSNTHKYMLNLLMFLQPRCMPQIHNTKVQDISQAADWNGFCACSFCELVNASKGFSQRDNTSCVAFRNNCPPAARIKQVLHNGILKCALWLLLLPKKNFLIHIHLLPH